MRAASVSNLVAFACALTNVVSVTPAGWAQKFDPVIPKTWDDAAMATLEVPLADPIGSPKHVSADYYYRIPVRPIYKSYPVYASGHEPPAIHGLAQATGAGDPLGRQSARSAPQDRGGLDKGRRDCLRFSDQLER
ncbi:MAG TPA: hypothetical protein VMT20_20690 [Terriglobia bacterium]|nr:hypothetical protein [Terriglobia bacterium]